MDWITPSMVEAIQSSAAESTHRAEPGAGRHSSTNRPAGDGDEPAGRAEAAVTRLTQLMSRATLREWGPLLLAAGLALGAEIAALASGHEGGAVPVTLAIAAILLGGREPLLRGWQSLRRRELNISLLMTIAVAGAVAIGEWPEAAMVIVLFAIAERLEDYSVDRARKSIQSLMSVTPDMATVHMDDGSWRRTAAADVTVGSMIRVSPGERVPLDGRVRSGYSAVDASAITGESMPVTRSPGDQVFAGSVNQHGALEIEVTAGYQQTTLARIIQTVQEAQASRAPTQRLIDRFARVYTPGVVAFAALVAAVPPMVADVPLSQSVYTALVLLVVACPCALVLATPVTLVSSLATAARRGILIKGGVHIERATSLRTLVFDKTGTITTGQPRVTDVVPLTDMSQNEALRMAASLNAPSGHPVARAIVAACEAHRNGLASVRDFKALPGMGASGRVGEPGAELFIGSRRLAQERLGVPPQVEAELDRLESEGKTGIVLGNEHNLLAVIAVADTVRPESAAAINALHRRGLRTILLTGDNTVTARAVGDEVGIADVRSEQLPADKLETVEALVGQQDSVGMVGDGINDAPALARATVGFAMGAAGTDVALETADVAIMDDDLTKLPEFLDLSDRTIRVLWQNICVAIGVKALFFVLALTGLATLWMAVLADMGTSLVVVANGLRLLSGPRHSVTPGASASPSPLVIEPCCSSCQTDLGGAEA